MNTLTRTTRPLAAASALGALLLTLAACGEPEPGPAATNRPRGPANVAPAADPEPPKPRFVFGTSQTEWPGVEARLITAKRAGTMFRVEIELANTGDTTATIENYSANEAVVVDEATKQGYAVVDQEGLVAATMGLNQALAPGEVTVINATFPLPHQAARVTLEFPRVGTFTGINAASVTGNAPGASQRKQK